MSKPTLVDSAIAWDEVVSVSASLLVLVHRGVVAGF